MYDVQEMSALSSGTGGRLITEKLTRCVAEILKRTREIQMQRKRVLISGRIQAMEQVCVWMMSD